ncbi:L-ribulose-5-phosphate 3-epimerase [Lacrimispora sp.]|jgi:L-ribulose-5-phosphate 3-epimerase|uniref:L-ribulose-5-phosphate 3-epimerase n=1 Tax=Lacrimispora sp. TaxID=2719234 RepID=UPI002896F573|nr:L-ribulose-5-phosphate 3-epimerase [Lacrimispora sp.]
MNSHRVYRLGLYEKSMPGELPFEEKFKAAKETGYDFIEMSIDETEEKISRLDFSDARILMLQSLSLDIGIRFESICFSAQRKFPLGSLLDGAADAAVELFKKCVDFAVKMGIRIIQAQGYDCFYGETSSAETREKFLDNLKLCMEYASAHGVMVGFETMENEFMNTVEKAMYFVNQAKMPYLSVYPDVGNIWNGADDIYQDLECGRSHICSVHLKETLPGRFREIPYGEGQVDFEKVIQTTRQLGIHRYVAEFWYTDEADYRMTLKKNNLFLKRYLDAVYMTEV